MELQEAYELTQISHKEISAIERYLGFKHTSINILADLSASRFKELESSGWSLPETTEELKPRLYFDEKENKVKGRCKLKPYKSYFAFEVREDNGNV